LAHQAELKKAKEQLEAARAECRTKYPNSHTQRADCFTAAEDTTIRPLINDGDLLSVMQAERKVLAIKVDQGGMTEADANLQMAKANAALRQQEIERNNATDAIAAQRSAASAQMLGAGAALLQANRPAPIMAPQPIVNTSCNRVGSFVNCTSY
jgi:hypothetical protein